jgi:hypothetical protein
LPERAAGESLLIKYSQEAMGNSFKQKGGNDESQGEAYFINPVHSISGGDGVCRFRAGR